MNVFRVEHSVTGFGPYQSGVIFQAVEDGDYTEEEAEELSALCSALGWAHQDDDHPCAYITDYAWRCGFLSMDDLHSWFDGWAERLNDHGYHVVEYNVPAEEMKIQTNQIIFNKPVSVVVTEYSLVEQS